MPTLTGSSGKTYKMETYPMCKVGRFDDLDEVPAVYVFARIETDAETGKRKGQTVYVGQTEDVNDRLDKWHHRMDDIEASGATHVFIYRNEKDARLKSERGRRCIEKDLIKRYRPEIQ